MRQEEVVEFILQRSARVLPQLKTLCCYPQGGDSLFFLHLCDPISLAELLLPISETWVQECRLQGDSSRLDRAFDLAAKILDFQPPSVGDGKRGPMMNPTDAGRRRSQRVHLVVPLNVAWTTPDGVHLNEPAKTEVVNAHGGLLQMKEPYPGFKEVVELSHSSTARSCKARIAWIFEPEDGKPARIAIELAVASQAFWGVSFPS